MSVDFIIKKELIKFNSFYPIKEACYILINLICFEYVFYQFKLIKPVYTIAKLLLVINNPTC